MHQETVVTAGEVSSPLRKSQEQVAGVKDASARFQKAVGLVRNRYPYSEVI